MPLLHTSITRKDLVQKCIQLIDTFDPKRTTVDAYVQDAPFLKDKRMGELEHKFVHQIFYGCNRYQKFLKLFVTSFLYKCPTCAIRSEQTLYMILAYLLFFRLEELEVPEFREILRCGLGTTSALLALLQYSLNVEELNKWVKVEWCKLYDVTFIENEVIEKLQSFKEELTPVVEEVELKATGVVAAAEGDGMVKTRKATVQKPFNLTKVRPRLIPEPEVISREVKAQPVPASSVQVGVLQQIEEEKRLRLEEEKVRVNEKYGERPKLRTEERVDENEREELTKKVHAEQFLECTFKPAPAKKYVPPTEEAIVKQTASSILREDALLKKKQQKEAHILKRYEEDLHDESEFQAWQQKQKLQDDAEEEQRVRQRMVEMQLAREEAMEAFEHCKRKKHIMAEHQKQELKTQLEEVEHEKQLQHQQYVELVAETQEDRKRARDAEQEVLQLRCDHAEKLRKEKEADFERKKREDQFEMERRKDLIRQIRALEKVPVERFKTFDRAEQPCQGLMEEMSYAELQERLKLLEAQRAKELEERKDRQLEKKLEKQQELKEKAETLARIRDMAKDEAKQRHAEKKAREAEIEERKQQYRDKCIEEAAEKIAKKKKQKRDEELALKRELKEIVTRNAFRSANAAAVEQKAHGEQQLGLEREARVRQEKMVTDQRKLNAINKSEKNLRIGNVERDAADFKRMQDAVTDRLQRAKIQDEKLKGDIKGAISAARDHQKTTEIKGRREFGHSSNAYIQKVQAMSM